MASALQTLMYVLGLLICGSLNTITLKISFTMTGINLAGQKELFQKPWFITFVMFVAMTLSLFFDKSLWRPRSAMQVSLIDDSARQPISASAVESELKWSDKVKMVAIPAVFDILATGLCSMGFLYLPASVWQLLRGAEMVFAALFAVIFLGRDLLVYHWLGVALCVAGIALVGLASIWGEPTPPAGHGGSDGASEKAASLVLLGMALALLGQVVQAAQVIAEEWLLKDVDLPGLQIVGFEGVWGAIIMLAVAFPLLYVLPGSDHGHLEDEADAVAMLASSLPLSGLVLTYTFSCATYNMSGIAVTGALSAVHRVMLEAFRTSIVWVFGLTVHYCFDPLSPFGEAWTPYSWLEVVGFAILMLGQAVYGEMIRIPGLTYPEGINKPAMFPSPGTTRSLVSPLPPAKAA